MNIIRKPCATRNFNRGRAGHQVSAIVIHVIDGSQASCDATFASNTLDMVRSAHYSVGRTGEVHQYVDETDTAFHAGRVLNPTAPLKLKPNGTPLNPNAYTIGIEHEGRASDEWTDAMYKTTSDLIRGILVRHPQIGSPLTTQNCWMHRQIFSGKSCPGFVFDMDKLLRLVNNPAVVPAQAPAAPGAAMNVQTVSNLNVRISSDVHEAPVGVLPAGTARTVTQVQGQMINGNAHWYQLQGAPFDQKFIWAGGTDHP